MFPGQKKSLTSSVKPAQEAIDMGYQNKSRPDNKAPKDLLVDARMDLQDLKYWVDEGGNPKDIIEAISFIRETLLIYQMTVYPPISEEDE